jgi:hypothetical protein
MPQEKQKGETNFSRFCFRFSPFNSLILIFFWSSATPRDEQRSQFSSELGDGYADARRAVNGGRGMRTTCAFDFDRHAVGTMRAR